MKGKHVPWMAAALAAVCLTYANAWHNGFHFDDFHTVVDNPWIRSLKNIPRFFTDTATFSVLPANRTYRPIVSTSLAIDYFLGHGLNPVFFHLGTFLVFLLQLCAMQSLFLAILDRTAPQQSNLIPATIATAWYGSHPAIAETVNYIIQRGDVFSTCGVVVALATYIRFPKLRRTGLYLVPFAIAMLSKPPAIVFPALLFVFILMFESAETDRLRNAALRSLPALLAGAGLMALQAAMTPKSYFPSQISNDSWYITQPFVLLRYFGSFFLPIHLNVDTDLRPFSHLGAAALSGFVFLAVLMGAAAWLSLRPRLRPVAFGLFWFLIASIPTSIYRLSEVENDHRMYMPFVGLVLAFVWTAWLGLERLTAGQVRRWIRPAAASMTVLLLGAYAWGAHLRNRVWRSEESLWLDDVQKCPHNGRGLMNYGLSQMERGRYQVARDYFTRALAYTPDYPTLEVNLGVVNEAMGQSAVADEHFQRAVQLAPADDEAHSYYGRALVEEGRLPEGLAQLQIAYRLNPSRPMTRTFLMDAFADSGDMPSARQLAHETLALIPGDPATLAFLMDPQSDAADYWINLSLRRYQQTDYAACITAARRALALQPDSALAWNNIGAAWAALSQWNFAVQAEQSALRLQPDLALARNNLSAYRQHALPADMSAASKTADDFLNDSLRLYRAGSYRESIAAARSALHLRPDYAEAWNNIAASYASLGEWDNAIQAAREAIRLKPNFQLARNNLAWAVSEKKKSAGQ